MKSDLNLNVSILFRIICLALTLALSGYWIYVFSLNEDLVTIEYRKYYAREKDVYPLLSLCLTNSISQGKLTELNANLSVASYLQFLSGETFNSTLVDINYQSIIENMTEFIEEDFIRFRNGSYQALHPDYNDSLNFKYSYIKNKRIYPSKYSFFSVNEGFYTCYELAIPHDKNIMGFWFRINTKIFPLRVRPKSYGLIAIIHYPNQLLISKTLKHLWPPWNKDEVHEMQFQIRGVEVLRRRQKWRRQCHDHWEDYDHYIIKNHLQSVGCRAPYLPSNNDLPPCRMKEEMEKKFYFQTDDYRLKSPCREMKKIYERFDESTHDVKEIIWARRGYFWLSIAISDEDFKEISETRYN